MKVKDPSFLEEAAFINFNVVKKEEMKVEKVNEEKYLEEARGIILQKIKETYTAKIMEVKKRKQE